MHRNICKNMLIIMRKSWTNPQLLQNPSKLCKNQSFWNVFGVISRTSRCQVVQPGKGYSTFGAFLAENVAQRGNSWDPPESKNGSKIWPLSIDGHFGPRKIVSGRRFWKTCKNYENLYEHRRFLMPQNHVWRYTLRLFHTVTLFEEML